MAERDINLEKIIQADQDREANERLAFMKLLDRQHEKANHVFALKAKMGVTNSYLTTVSLSWIESNVKFASDLPLFEGKSDRESKRVAVNADTLELLQQRKPDWRRQLPMSEYLTRENHKFPPMLVVGYQRWAYQDRDESDNWDIDGRAIKPSIPVLSLDSSGHFLDIENKDTDYYALDGQHRLMAIMGLKELLRNRQLRDRKQDGSLSQKTVELDEIISLIIRRRQNAGNEDADRTAINEMLQGRMHEHMGIEIIPAVQEGETRENAVARLRQVFVDVNENAKLPSKGDNILLDQTNGFRIIARRAMVSHKLLNNGKTSDDKMQLVETSEYYTTLYDLAVVAERYLGQIQGSEYSNWKNYPALADKKFGYIRPSEDVLEEGKSDLMEYFNALAKLPSHERFMKAAAVDRHKLRSENRNDPLADNILFRPIAQSALAGAIGFILHDMETEKSKFSEKLNEIVKVLAEQESKGNLKLRKKEAPWHGVLCDSAGKMRRKEQYKELCERMFVYLLHDMRSEDVDDLREKFAEARTEARTAPNKEGVKLPPPWNR